MNPSDPQAAKEVAELARQMQKVDPTLSGQIRHGGADDRECSVSVDLLNSSYSMTRATSGARTGKP